MACILLVEDDDDLRDALSGILEDAGHTVIEASDGASVGNLMSDHIPDAVVSDLIMDGVEGIETIRRVRDASAETPILTISGNAMYLNNSAKLGATAVLLKPFPANVFLSTVEELLQTREVA